MSKVTLPDWARTMREIFRAETVSQFVLYGNVHDLVPHREEERLRFLTPERVPGRSPVPALRRGPLLRSGPRHPPVQGRRPLPPVPPGDGPVPRLALRLRRRRGQGPRPRPGLARAAAARSPPGPGTHRPLPERRRRLEPEPQVGRAAFGGRGGQLCPFHRAPGRGAVHDRGDRDQPDQDPELGRRPGHHGRQHRHGARLREPVRPARVSGGKPLHREDPGADARSDRVAGVRGTTGQQRSPISRAFARWTSPHWPRSWWG